MADDIGLLEGPSAGEMECSHLQAFLAVSHSAFFVLLSLSQLFSLSYFLCLDSVSPKTFQGMARGLSSQYRVRIAERPEGHG